MQYLGKLRIFLQEFAEQWADNVFVASDEERLKIAHWCCLCIQFYKSSFCTCRKLFKTGGLDFNCLQPLIEETIKKTAFRLPSLVQTGPALRNDTSTIEKHKALLSKHPKLLNIYNELTNSILRFYNNRKS
jgi:hypothetical protein